MLSDELDTLKVEQRKVVDSFEELMESDVLSESFRKEIYKRFYVATENAHRMGRMEARIDYA